MMNILITGCSSGLSNGLTNNYLNEGHEDPQTHFCALAPGLIETGMQDYLNNLPEAYEKKFPMVKKLKDARGTESMPKPDDAAVIVADAIQKVTEYESGSFLDVRNM